MTVVSSTSTAEAGPHRASDLPLTATTEKEDSMEEAPIKLLAIQAKNDTDGFYVTFIPDELDEDQVAAAFAELGIEVERSMEIDEWQTSSSNLTVAFVPFPPPVIGAKLLEPSRS